MAINRTLTRSGVISDFLPLVSSSLDESLADLLGKKKGKKDELDAKRFHVTRLNDSLAGGKAALMDSVSGPAAGDTIREEARSRRISRSWGRLLKGIGEDKRQAVAAALEGFEKKEEERRVRLRAALDKWRSKQLSAQSKSESGVVAWFASFFRSKSSNPETILAEQMENEAELFQTLGKQGVKLEIIRDILKCAPTALALLGGPGHELSREALSSSNGGPSAPPGAGPASGPVTPPLVFVLDFVGDVKASRVTQLAAEISALLSLPPEARPSEVVLRIKSPGGSVTGYGLASAEVERLVAGGIALTVCVDEVAASGGYLMACVATTIYCSPFAAIGSIGVVQTVPNAAKRMRTEGIEVFETTAGKYKRTVSPYLEPTASDLAKVKEDVERILRLFSGRISAHRSKAIEDVVAVATGEVWFGPDALRRGLVDGLATSEEYLQRRMGQGAELFHVQLAASKEGAWWQAQSASADFAEASLPQFASGALPALRMGGDLHGQLSRLSPEQKAALFALLVK